MAAAIGHILFFLGLYYFQKMSKPHARIDIKTKELIIEYNSMMKFIAIILYFFFTGLLLIIVAIAKPSPYIPIIFAFFFTLFTVLPGSILIETFGVSHRLSKKGIYKHSPWSKDFFVNWNEIEKIISREIHGQYFVKTKKGMIRFSHTMDGIIDFIAYVNIYSSFKIRY